MEKLTFTTVINAPKEKVWHAMLDDATYREWTKPFNAGSRHEGKWETGSEMRFIGVDDEDGYPVAPWKKVEAEYIKKMKAKDPNFVYKPIQKARTETYGFKEYADRPRRYRYWYLETDYVPPSKRKK